MAALRVTLDKLLICDPERSRSTCNVFVSHVDDADRERLGRVFIVAELTPAHPENQELIHLIQETINRAYYSVTDRGVETAFEHALAEANARLQELVREDQRNWLSGLALFAGVVKDSSFVFTQVGSIQGFLLRGTRIVDLLHGSASPIVNPLKIFSSVVSGQLEEHDHVVVATSSVLDYFSQEKIRRTVQAAPPSESAAYFDQLLRDNPSNTAFAALILTLESSAQPTTSESIAARVQPGPLPLGQPRASMDQLIEKEAATRELLEPSFWRSITQLARHSYQRTEDAIRTRVLRKPTRRRLASPWRESAGKPRSMFVSILLWLWSVVKRLFVLLFMVLVTGVSAVRRLFTRSPHREPGRTTVGEQLSGLVGWIQRMTGRQRLVFIGMIALVLALTQGLLWYAGRDTNALSADERAQIVATVRAKTEEINTVLSYGDEQAARQLLNETDGLIAQLPSKRRADREIVDELTAGLADAKAKTRRLEKPVLVEHTTLAGLGTPEPRRVVRAGTSLYVVTSIGEVIDVTNEGAPRIVGAPLDEWDVIDVAPDGDNVLLLQSDALTRFTVESQQYSALTIALPDSPGGLVTFQNRLYLLDRTGGQILRYPRTSSGYGASQPWLTDPSVTLTDARSLAIDGAIYVLQANGTVLELVRGEQQDLAFDPIDPPLSSAALLWTEELSDFLYVFSPETNRLAVFKKNGALKVQYEDASFGSATGFAVDETNAVAYVLSGNSVVRFPLNLQ
ncbi:MAG: hypothetical protein HYZ09_02960 [Candidatus Kerfeldbacteria bacterium]|nr:hypothetical protein [Candidatus Kerfeldbacteria bacterium]